MFNAVIFSSCRAAAISTVFVAALFGLSIARRMLELRLEERVNVRACSRILKTALKFPALALRIPERPDVQAKLLESVLEQAKQAIIEGRDAALGFALLHDCRQ